jgi:ankyrin repeat protein
MLIRKLDWHDYDGLQYMLEHGADANGERNRGWHSLYHSLRRVNGLEFIQLLLDHGANPLLVSEGFNAVTAAACEGRGDVLKLFAQRGILITLEGVYQLIAACAMGDAEKVKAIVYGSPALLQQFQFMGGELLARFCLCGNEAGVRQLLHIGISVNAPYRHGDGYYGIPPGSLAIHVAALRGYPAVVQLLIESGALVDVPDKNGQTPLALAIKACVDSYWTQRRSPDSVKALLEAGASAQNIPFPCGYDEVDALLAHHRQPGA